MMSSSTLHAAIGVPQWECVDVEPVFREVAHAAQPSTLEAAHSRVRVMTLYDGNAVDDRRHGIAHGVGTERRHEGRESHARERAPHASNANAWRSEVRNDTHMSQRVYA